MTSASHSRHTLVVAILSVATLVCGGLVLSFDRGLWPFSSSGAQAGQFDPATYQPETVDPEDAERFVLVSVPAGEVDQFVRDNPGAKVLLPSQGGDAVVGIPREGAGNLPDNQDVVVEDNQPITSFDVVEQSAPSWGLDRIDQASLPLDSTYRFDSSGAGVTVYVVDSGINTSHEAFSGRLREGYSAIPDGVGVEDCNGHGTHVAGTAIGSAVGVAQSATVVPVRVLDCNGASYASSVLAGLNWIVNTHPGGPAVINLSLGGPRSEVLNTAVEQAVSRGFVVVAAAGNSSANACDVSPVSASGVIGVGASTSQDAFASFSNYGSCVDVLAPGVSIVSAWTGSASSRATLSGTSMASPHLAGMAARLMQSRPGIGAGGILEALGSSQTEQSVSGLPSDTSSLLSTWEEIPLEPEELVDDGNQEGVNGQFARGNSDNAPGRSGVAPGNSGDSPGRTGSAPGLQRQNGKINPSDSAPGQQRANPPGRVRNVTVVPLSETAVRVNWAAMSPTPDEVEVAWKRRSDPDSAYQLSTLPGSVRETTLEGLQAGERYTVRITAVNILDGARESGESVEADFALQARAVNQGPPQTPPGQNRQGSPPPVTEEAPPAEQDEQTDEPVEQESESPEPRGRAGAPGQNR